MGELKIGDQAPDISCEDQEGDIFNLSEQRGKKVVLFFYPKDNTEGCTKEACNLRDNYAEFQRLNYVLIGVSADSKRKHQNFINKYQLPFPLLADTDKKVIMDYGVWGWKKFMGREFEGILRTTFIINENGIITDIIEKVNTKEHSAQILN